jgi:hypothetical protein
MRDISRETESKKQVGMSLIIMDYEGK